MKSKDKKVNIKEQGDESPFILDLKPPPAPPLIKGGQGGVRPRRLVSYYYKLKYYFLLLFYGEKQNFYNAPQRIENFKFFNNFAVLCAFAAPLYSAVVFVLKSFKDVFAADKTEIELIDSEPLMLRQPPLAFAYASIKKHLCAFLIILFIISSPFVFISLHDFLKTKAASAEESGRRAVEVLKNFEEFDSAIESASLNFQTAYQNLQDINIFLRGLLDVLPGRKGEEYRTAKKIFSAAREITSSISVWKDAFDALKVEKENLKRIELLEETIKLTEPKISVAFYNLNSIDAENLPAEIRTVFDSARDYFYKIMDGMEELKENCLLLKEALGVDEPKRYLLIFQNNNELRPTGGFMGSFAEIVVEDGKIVKTYFPGGGTYDLEGALKRFVVPPEPLQLVSERWEFQDANWFPDFPTSARKIMWFYENSDGPTVDGVIVINANFVADLLGFLGPIEVEGWDKILAADNFIDEIQQAVEVGYDKKENQPKKILVDFYPLLLEKTGNAWGENFAELIKIFGSAVQQKNIQFYFSDKDLQKKVLTYGAGGEINSTGGDYLYIVNTNIAGGKTDGAISETINLQTEISESGIIINTLVVSRKHTGVKRQGFSGVRNVDYVRIYVPKGSRLLKAEGFTRPPEELFKTPLLNLEIDKDLSRAEKLITYDKESGVKITEEFNKTTFGNWIMIDPQEEVAYTIVYQLPMIADFVNKNFWSYTFLTQKQSGSNPAEFIHTLNAPEEFRQFWHYPEVNDKTIILDKDFFSAVIFSKYEGK